MTKSELRIVFFGTPAFAAHSLQQIVNSGFNVVAVVTAPDKPAGRGMKLKASEVKVIAQELNLPILQPVNLKDPSFQDTLRQLQADLGIVIAFRMLPQAVWSMPKLGTFNLHGSLLPQYRGAAPINHAIIEGEKTTGVTTFFLKHEIDTGDIVLQSETHISPEDNAGTLHDKLMLAGSDLVLETLELILNGNWPEKPQDMSMPMKAAPKINREFCQLHLSSTVVHVHNKIRGLSPFPGAWINSTFGVLKIYKTKTTEIPTQGLGIHIQNGQLWMDVSDGVLEILELQPEGKNRMKSADFINGLANKKS